MTISYPGQDLDRLLLACEDAILEMDDKAVLVEAGDAASAAGAIVGRLVAAHLAGANDVLPPRRAARRTRVPGNARSRRQMLGRLVASRSGLPERVKVAFMSGDMDDSEIAALLEDLLSAPDEPDAE